MRYSKGHKEATRQKIVDTASARFRGEGIAAVGVANLMSDIGLTQGGFYNHFESKDELAREAVAKGWQGTCERLEKVLGDPEHGGVEAVIESYLSPRHRDHMAEGCVAAALSPEIARGADIVRAEFTKGTEHMVSLLARALPKTLKPKQRRATAMAVFSTLVGTLALARAVNDADASEEILAAGRKAALALLPAA
ncbi:MAG TPA: TetR/AcrR family transcriptional regulator [Dyella sp.]|uniref:TetR/AcrR family transcriptional regulator n=1 Tax=Dyella sp. TaxID=1869338 RepID=UPI002D7681C8|nr:TetR/AcrR family transcriptional regulator [Dyella sp.]HET6554789.1 TetR/AcrR family transcriptional regulator [Dyella sp.]